MDAAFRKVLTRIADVVGEHAADMTTDHGRWHLYQSAMNSPAAYELLRQSVALEEDRALAVSVVLRMLEQVVDEQQADWISQLAPDNRAFSERRAFELGILRKARIGALSEAEIAVGLEAWTDWLQFRLVDVVVGRANLVILSMKGRTKRIRNAAAARLRSAGD